MLIVAKELVPAGMLEARAVALGGSQPRGEMPNGVDGDADWLGSVRPDGGSGLVRVPGEKAVNWSSGGMAWAAECRGHVDRVSPVNGSRHACPPQPDCFVKNVHAISFFTERASYSLPTYWRDPASW